MFKNLLHLHVISPPLELVDEAPEEGGLEEQEVTEAEDVGVEAGQEATCTTSYISIRSSDPYSA